MSVQKFLLSSALVLAITAPAFAQEDYTEFASKEDFFTITFPGKPVVTDGTWLTDGLWLTDEIYLIFDPPCAAKGQTVQVQATVTGVGTTQAPDGSFTLDMGTAVCP